MRVFLFLLPSVLTLSMTCLGSGSSAYKFQALQFPGAPITVAHGINNSNEIVGAYQDSTGQHGFLLSQGVYSTIEVPGAWTTTATGINDNGVITGYFQNASGFSSFLLSNGQYTVVNQPGFHDYAQAINNSNIIVGFATVGSSLVGFAYSPSGVFTNTLIPGQGDTYFQGVNNHGVISGFADSFGDNSTFTEGFLLAHGKVTGTSFPGATATTFTGLNDNEEVVGYITVQFVNHGFTWQNGKYTRFTVPGSQFTSPYGVNNAGAVVGAFGTSLSQSLGFLATPVSSNDPE